MDGVAGLGAGEDESEEADEVDELAGVDEVDELAGVDEVDELDGVDEVDAASDLLLPLPGPLLSLPEYASLYQPLPFKWNDDKEIFFETSVPEHWGHGGAGAPARMIVSNSWLQLGQAYS